MLYNYVEHHFQSLLHEIDTENNAEQNDEESQEMFGGQDQIKKGKKNKKEKKEEERQKKAKQREKARKTNPEQYLKNQAENKAEERKKKKRVK